MIFCGVYLKIWDRAMRLKPAQVFNINQKAQIDFPKWDAYHAKQPPMQSRALCRCGAPDKWACWHRVKMSELLGEGRK